MVPGGTTNRGFPVPRSLRSRAAREKSLCLIWTIMLQSFSIHPSEGCILIALNFSEILSEVLVSFRLRAY